MPLNNMISLKFEEAETTAINEVLVVLANIMKGKSIALSPEDRQRFGSVGDNNKKIINKVKTYLDMYPEHIPSMFSKEEFIRDFESREVLENCIKQLKGILDQMVHTKIMLDYDNYNNALIYYRYFRFLSENKQPGAESVYLDLKKHFANGGSSSLVEPSEDNTASDNDATTTSM